MSAAQHTRGTWVTTKKFEIGVISREDDQSNGMVIPFADVFGDNREANAAHIVKCVNAYDELVAALEAMVVWANGNGATGGYPGTQARAALLAAQAHGGSL